MGAQTAAPILRASADSTIPSGLKGLAIQEGKKLLTETHHPLPTNVGNGLNCTSCHLAERTIANASPWVGIRACFPSVARAAEKLLR